MRALAKLSIFLLFFSIIPLLIITSLPPESSVEEYENETLNYTEFVNQKLDKGEILGKDELGKVVKAGPYGNTSSSVKIAYIVGVHPMEDEAHLALLEALLEREANEADLKYRYYIYATIVRKDVEEYNASRMNGQLLTSRYSVPDIIENNFDLVIDVHSHDKYEDKIYSEKVFIFAPLRQEKSLIYADWIVNMLPWLVYYVPPRINEPTSAPYVTEPIIRSGIPALVYESYILDSYDITLNNARDFILAVDSLKF